MNERNLRVLEFGKIRERMAALAITQMGRECAMNIEPSSDAYTVRRRQAETEEASTVLAYNGANPMAWFTDVRDHLKLAAIGSTLSAKALLQVADALKAARLVRNALVTDREDTPLLTSWAPCCTPTAAWRRISLIPSFPRMKSAIMPARRSTISAATSAF